MNPSVEIDMSNPDDVILSSKNILMYEKQGYIISEIFKVGDSEKYLIRFIQAQ